MKKYVLISIDFKKDLGQSRRRGFAREMKERDWRREIPSAFAWWKRIDDQPRDRAQTEIRKSAKEAGIKQYNVMLQVCPEKPTDF